MPEKCAMSFFAAQCTSQLARKAAIFGPGIEFAQTSRLFWRLGCPALLTPNKTP
jgi:hypothetical protein